MSMNHRPRMLRPGPECTEFAPLLALVGQDDLDDYATNDLRRHLTTCAYCRQELHSYNTLDAALSRHFGVPARSPLSRDDIRRITRDDYHPASDVAEVSEEPEPNPHERRTRSGPPFAGGEPPRRMPRRQRTRRMLSIFTAIAAVLVITLVAAALYVSHRGPANVGHTPTPTLSGTTAPHPYLAQPGDELNSIYMVSPNDGWIVGDHSTVTSGSPEDASTLILHYIKGQWLQVASPTGKDLHAQNLTLSQVAMASTSEGWAVGTAFLDNSQSLGFILHYTSGQWSLFSTFDGLSLESIFLLSSINGWIGGSEGCCGPNAGQAILLHYDGTGWKKTTAPGLAISQVFMTSASEGWAVSALQVNGFDGPLGRLLYYQGNTWSEVKIPGIEEVIALSLPAANDGWLVGLHFLTTNASNALFSGIPSQVVLAHYNGKSWAVVNTTEVSTYQNASLGSISLASPTEGWAVGSYSTSNGNSAPLYYHYSGGTWKRVDGPGPGQLTYVFALSADDAWATGGNGSILHYHNGAWELLNPGSLPATPTPQTANGTPIPTPCSSDSGPSLQPPGPGTPVPIIPFTGWATYTSAAYHFTINYPKGWVADNVSCPDTQLLIFQNYEYPQANNPGFPPGAIKIELDVRDNTSGLTALDFWNQEMQADQQGVGGPPCPSFTTRQLQVAGRSAVEGGCPSLRWDSYFIPDGKVMLVITGYTANGVQPSDMLTQMVNSLAFTS
jgi:hypothetical protein